MIDISKEISTLRQIPDVGQFLGSVLETLQEGINNVALTVGSDPTRKVPAPPTIQGLTVKTDGNGNVHAVISDNNIIQKGLHYFVEYQQMLSGGSLVFSQPHVVALGPSRTMHPIALPAMDDNGNPVHYIFQAYSQYIGGDPGAKVRYGGISPVAVSPGGNGRMTLIPSTGSGTADSSGQQAGSGFGRNLFRNPITPKRTAK